MVGYNEALGLPKGSVRAILALATVVGGIALMVKGVVQFEQFMTMVAAVFAFYFSSKGQEVNVNKEEVCDD